ncbi:MAG: xanthine dehydrogenase family protein molybdopterin-binding subunit [Caulobacteraceae bacterium]|nr:xanthine dehydrogenase family protein molybdopterin-binding subunit [Caulobacteraceae bacterium]
MNARFNPDQASPARGLSRREVIVTATAAGALLVGCSPSDLMAAGAKTEVGAFGPFIKIAPDGAVTLISKHIEFGQGNHAGLAAIVAEELDADWDRVGFEHAPANAKLYANGGLGAQLTGGSTAINNSWDQLRKAGAAARAMFVEAAANRWGAPAGEITVANGVVSHAASSRSATFAELLEDAARVTPPEEPKLKDPAQFTLIGTDRVRRKDSRTKSTGQTVFTIDVQAPNLLVAMVAHPPRFGAKVASFDSAAALKVPGVVAVHEIPSGVAVVAETTWAAKQGRDALTVQWDEAKAETRGSAEILTRFQALAAGSAEPADGEAWESFESKGEAATQTGGDLLEVAYDFPYLAHATMEPMDCVAEVKGNKVKLTFASQGPTLDQLNVARIVANLPGAVEIETLPAGGSFGRRANFQSDFVVECVHIAKKVGEGRPVKLVWTREDDMAAGYYRPLVHHRVQVRTGGDGFPTAWTHKIVTQSIMKGAPFGGGGVDETAVEGAKGSPYLKATPHVDAQLITPDIGVPVLWWRSVGATHTAYVMEHTIEQLARKAGQDPVAYRRALYQKAGAERHLAVLDLAAEKAGWGQPAPEGWTRGVAVHESFGSVVAQVAEVKLENGEPRVGRVVTAIDCGTAIAPDQIAAQMEGGTCYGLSAALYGQITLTEGRVDQTNFDTYRVLRHNEAPRVETCIVAKPAGTHPTGVGEPGTPVIGPAVANALLALNGEPITAQPFVKV